MLPYLKKTENYFKAKHIDESQHGQDGIFRTTSEKKGLPLQGAYRKAFEAIGLKFNLDMNEGDPSGISFLVENWVDGKRQPSAIAYGLEGIHVITEKQVERILFENKNGQLTAVGV